MDRPTTHFPPPCFGLLGASKGASILTVAIKDLVPRIRKLLLRICVSPPVGVARKVPGADRVRQYLHNAAEHTENWNEVTLPLREFGMLKQKELREVCAVSQSVQFNPNVHMWPDDQYRLWYVNHSPALQTTNFPPLSSRWHFEFISKCNFRYSWVNGVVFIWNNFWFFRGCFLFV